MLTVDLFTELTCPWGIIGMHRLAKVLAARFPMLKVDIRHHPVVLMRDCPREGLKMADVLRTRYGVSDPQDAFARPEAAARASGLDLDLSRQAMAYPTLAAHTLVRLAQPRGTQHALAFALSKAHFIDARNIADPEVLGEIAAAYGFEAEEAAKLAEDLAEQAATEAEVERSSAQGVQSVPHFVFDGTIALNGGRSEDELAAAIETALAEAPVRA